MPDARQLAPLCFALGESMSCNCADLAETCYAKPNETQFVRDFTFIEVDADNWRELYECPACHQVWAVEHDEIMNKFHRLAFKLRSKSDWFKYDYQSAIENFKIEEHGGLSNKKCLQKGCTNWALLNCYLCAKHY